MSRRCPSSGDWSVALIKNIRTESRLGRMSAIIVDSTLVKFLRVSSNSLLQLWRTYDMRGVVASVTSCFAGETLKQFRWTEEEMIMRIVDRDPTTVRARGGAVASVGSPSSTSSCSAAP